MQISKKYGSLLRESALMIVTGKHVAMVYEIKDGRVDKEPAIRIDKPWLTDMEGLRRRKGRGTIWGTPSNYEQHNDNTDVAFFKILKKELKDALQKQD